VPDLVIEIWLVVEYVVLFCVYINALANSVILQ
jgi:hypothetical protein